MTSPNLRTVPGRAVAVKVDARRQDFGPLRRRPHLQGVITQGLIYGKDQQSPPHIRLLDDSRETSERSLRHQEMEFVDEVVNERDPCSPGEVDSREGIEEPQAQDDIR